jgi:hypothetical protein
MAKRKRPLIHHQSFRHCERSEATQESHNAIPGLRLHVPMVMIWKPNPGTKTKLFHFQKQDEASLRH